MSNMNKQIEVYENGKWCNGLMAIDNYTFHILLDMYREENKPIRIMHLVDGKYEPAAYIPAKGIKLSDEQKFRGIKNEQ